MGPLVRTNICRLEGDECRRDRSIGRSVDLFSSRPRYRGDRIRVERTSRQYGRRPRRSGVVSLVN